MGILWIALIFVSVIALFYAYRQHSKHKECRSINQNNDQLIHTLTQKLQDNESKLAQSQSLHNTISNAVYDAIFILDENHKLMTLNATAQKLINQPSPIGQPLSHLIDSPEIEETLLRALQDMDDFESQLVIDNHFYRARMQSVHDIPQQDTLIILVLQDITDLVRISRSRRDMVANISHELRTPIANIRLIIDSLFYDQDKPKRKASIASLRDIARETDSLLWLVQELLDLSMIESGQAIMKLMPNNLLQIIQETTEHIQEQLNVKSLSISVHVPDKFVALCDREQTRRVITNLVRNAIKWSPSDESIIISAISDGDEISISVLDNGPGVPEDQRERIFERFYQVDTARTKREGSGLGLAICKHIVEAHGGRIFAEGNSKGHGGCFTFTLIDSNAGQYQPDSLNEEYSLPCHNNDMPNDESSL